MYIIPIVVYYVRSLLYTAYTMAKYGMSMCVLGMSEELKADGIAVNALWPRTGTMTLLEYLVKLHICFHLCINIM